MNSKITRYFFCLLLTTGILPANDTFQVQCKKKCTSCQGSSPCSPDSDTYQVVSTFDKEDKANAEASRLNGEQDGKWKDCKVVVISTTTPGGGSGGSNNSSSGPSIRANSSALSSSSSPGLTAANYQRQGLIFEGVSPDYVKFETVSQTTNGVTTTVKKPIQVPTQHSTIFYTDLPDGSGYQCAQYLNSQISAPDGNGLRTIPPSIQPTSITTYRHPVGTPTTDLTTLDVVHKQRHPQTGAWVTRTLRKVSPQGNNIWTTKFYLGDPNETNSIPLESYREITITRTPNPSNATEESTREITKDRDSTGTLVITSDHNVTYGFYKYGEPVKISETAHTGTASELTTTTTYYTDPAVQAAYNKPATIRRSDGQWSNITYQGSTVTGILLTKTVSGWLDTPAPAIGTAPDEAANRVVIEIEAKNETGTYSREEKIQGTLTSRTWGERYKDNSGLLTDKSRIETGAATLTTLRTGYPTDVSIPEADRGRMKSILHPDGTVALYTHALQGENRLVTIDSGTGSLAAVIDGTRTVSTFTKDDILIQETIRDIASGVLLSTRQAIAFDANDQPTRWAYDNDPADYSETLNGCCGIDSTRTRDGVTTTYTRDGLKRPKTATSLGTTLTYTYGSKTLGTTAFPIVNITATAGGLTLDKGTTVLDQAGNVLQQISPDLNGDSTPEITATTRDFATRTTTTLHPNGGTVISTNFADGQTKSTTGTATAPAYFTHAIHTQQGGGELTATASTITGPWTRTYSNLAGRTLKTTFAGATTELALQTTTYDPLGRPIATTDADGVAQLTAYNAKGQAYRSAIDLNQNGLIDTTDRTTDTLQDVLATSPVGPALRTRTLLYDLSNNPIILTTRYQSPDGLTTRQETLGVATPTTATSASHTVRATGSWTDTTTAPDGTKQVIQYSNWLATSVSSLKTENSTLKTSTTTYDPLRRPITTTDARTGLVTTNYTTSGQVAAIDDHGRITRFTYDSMGRRTATTLPDTTVTRTSYWLTGQVKATYGSQTTPTVQLYNPQGQPTELRTFRSTNLTLAPDETTGNYDSTTWLYNPRQQLTRKQYADAKGTDYTYTAAGRLKTRTWARNTTTTYSYDPAGQLALTDYSDATPDVTILFDKLGRQQSVTTSVAKSEFTYQPATLALLTETISYNLDATPGYEFTRTLDRTRDSLGRDTGFQLKSGTTLENSAIYTYSLTDGRLATVGSAAVPAAPVGVSPPVFSYSYTPSSNLLASVTGPIHTVTNVWEPTRDVLDLKQNKVGTTTISSYDYSVNAIGQRTGVATSGTAYPAIPSWLWSYDALGQVIAADSSVATSDRSYQYDTIGNRQKSADSLVLPVSNNYTTNALNQYTARSVGVSPTLNPLHDFDGNMTSGPLPTAPTTNSTLVWDAENRLIRTTVGSTITTYQYDAQSRRIAKIAGTTTTGAAILYLYDAWNCIADYERGTGVSAVLTLKKTRLWGTDLSSTPQGAGGVAGLLCESQISNSQISNFYPTYDGNGNISEYLTATGTTAAHFEYDPFGNTVVNTDSSNLFTYRFSTKPKDTETGLYYYGYRYYDPTTGRWPSRDPIGERGGVNLYGFVFNNGIGHIDHLGRNPLVVAEVCAAGSGATATAALVAAAYGLSTEKCRSDPKCSAALFIVENPNIVLWIAGTRAICKCKDLVLEMTKSKKCTWSGVFVSGAGELCEYTCEDGQKVRGEATSTDHGTDCEPTIDDPRD